VNRILHGFSFLGLNAATMRRYVANLPRGMSLTRIGFIVFVPVFIFSPVPSINLPNSSSHDSTHRFPLLHLDTSKYCAVCWVLGLKALPWYATCAIVCNVGLSFGCFFLVFSVFFLLLFLAGGPVVFWNVIVGCV